MAIEHKIYSLIENEGNNLQILELLKQNQQISVLYGNGCYFTKAMNYNNYQLVYDLIEYFKNFELIKFETGTIAHYHKEQELVDIFEECKDNYPKVREFINKVLGEVFDRSIDSQLDDTQLLSDSEVNLLGSPDQNEGY